jgi:hypothetical protein
MMALDIAESMYFRQQQPLQLHNLPSFFLRKLRINGKLDGETNKYLARVKGKSPFATLEDQHGAPMLFNKSVEEAVIYLRVNAMKPEQVVTAVRLLYRQVQMVHKKYESFVAEGDAPIGLMPADRQTLGIYQNVWPNVF